MPINPFPRVQGLDLPVALPSAARADPQAFNNLASIGENIGAYRLRQQMADLVASAGTDEQGNVDQGKAIAALARAGLVTPEQLSRMGYQQQLIAQHAADAKALETHRRAQEDTARIAAERPQYHFQAPVEPDILTPGRPGAIFELPRRPGQPPISYPLPGATPPPATTPGPQSDLQMPGGPSFASFDPNDPENAPPYTVAGPPMPPPQAPAPMAPAATATQPAAAARNDAYLRSLPTDAGRTLVKGIADYEIDPASLPAEIRAKALAAAKTYRPDYSASEYQKRAAPPSGEVAARIGLAKAFLERAPEIRQRLQANELNSWQGAATALWGQGGPGELRRGIEEGSESLLRTLTGAGMNKDEAAAYARRYQFDPRDNKDTAIRKLNELENALRHVTTEILSGRGNEDLVKGFKSQFGQPVTVNAPDKAIRDLQANPARRDEFDAKYGAGSADLILGARR